MGRTDRRSRCPTLPKNTSVVPCPLATGSGREGPPHLHHGRGDPQGQGGPRGGTDGRGEVREGAQPQGWGASRGCHPVGPQPPVLPLAPAWPHRGVHLDESIASPVVRNGEAKCILRLGHLHLLCLAPDMGKDEVLEADLSPQQLLHVHFVCVERAKEDLPQGTPSSGAGEAPAGQGGHWQCRGRSWPGLGATRAEGSGDTQPAQGPCAPFPRLQATWQLASAREWAAPARRPCARGETEAQSHPSTPQRRRDSPEIKTLFSRSFWGLHLQADGDPQESWPRMVPQGQRLPALGTKPPPHALAATAPSPRWARC